MTPEELKRQEDSARDILDALARLTRHTQAPPDFVATVMAQIEPSPPLSMRLRVWLRTWLQWPASSWARVATIALLFLAFCGAVPQYVAWLQAYLLDVPSEAIHEAQLQERLWHKNFACATRLDHSSHNYASLAGDRVIVVVWACPSGDVLVTLESPDEPSRERYVWIELAHRHTAQDFLMPFVRQAFAEDVRPGTPLVMAQTARVLCQKWLAKGLIKRRVQLANGQCQDEVINPRGGRVVERRGAPCDPSC
jgi:hypothetical protein